MWFLSRPTIRQKLTIVIALVSAMALGIFAAITIFEAARDARAELTNQALLLSEVGANALEAPVVFKDKKAALEMLAILGASEALVAADVHDAESKIFAERKFRRFTGPGIHEDHREMPKAVRFEYHHSTLHLGRPITSDGKIIGFLHLTFDLSNRFAALKTDAGIAILMAIGLLIVSMLLALAFGRVLTGPILKLTGTMREVAASNDFSHQLEVRSRDEVGELTHGFNSMLRGLAQRESELEEYREGLEELVEERTHELATTNTKLKGQIAQRERAETDLRKAKDLAEEASRAKSEFLANMSHEIRTPMNGVLGMTELLAKSPLDERQQQLVDTVRHSGQTLLRVINDILDFSRMGAEQFSLELADFDLHSAVEKTVDLFSEVARNKEIGLELHIQDAVPPAAIGDESRLRQVLGNIINNAIKFTLEGKVSVDVRAREKDGRSEVSFEVSDTGIGIAESDLNLIFDPFRQADGSTSRRFGGTGLGLVIAKNIVEKMGGTISVHSEVGKGSAFTIQIPFDEAAEGFTGQRGELGNVPRVHSEETGGQHHDLRQYSARVLVAEDNAVNQEVARENLILLGCTVEIAVDGKQAVDKWHSLSPDLILMDCQMPEVDGFVATEIIRQHEAAQGTGAHVPIIALTAHVLEKDRNKCLAAGMDDHLPKPFNIGQLNEILDRWLSSETACQASKLETEESPPVSKTPPPAQGAQESMTDAIDHDALNRLRHLYKDNSAGFRKTVQLFLDTGT